MLQAQDDLVFELTDIIQGQSLHELVIRHDSLLGRNVSYRDELEFLYLSWLEGQVACLVGLILDDGVVGEKIQRL